jgi:succinate dehydrogenase/fumarate reductase flavoprotein subunit
MRNLKSDIVNEKSDVLIIGGGLAGCFTAISAIEEGMDVAILEKADIRRSGCAGPGLDGAQLIDREITISPTDFRDSLLKRSNGMVDAGILETFSEWMGDSKQRLLELENYGVKVLKDEKFCVYSHLSHEIGFEGRDLKPSLAAEVKRRGVRVYNHTMAVGLLKAGDTVIGAMGLNIHDGSMTTYSAPVTVMVTGSATRLYGPPGLGPFVNDYCPACCGDGHVMAYDAGARIAGMEFTRVSVKPLKHWLCRSINHVGAVLRTAEGEIIVKPGGSQDGLFWKALSIQQEGKQLLWDATGLSDKEHEHIQFEMENEKPISLKYGEDIGFDFRKSPLEGQVMPWSFRAGLAGVVVDKNMQTSLNGLYAVGDVAGGTGIRLGAMMCCVYGYRIGKITAEHAKNRETGEVKQEQIETLANTVLEPLGVRGGYNPLDVEKLVQHIVTTYSGIFRTGAKLSWGLNELDRVKKEMLPKLSAETPHDLMRAYEARCITTIAEMHMRAAFFRTESRMAPAHYRVDYPEQDDDNWKSIMVVIQKRDGEMVLSKNKLNAGGD